MTELLEGIKAVAFDAVGTLIFPRPSAPEVYAEVGRRFGSLLSVTEIGARFVRAFQREEIRDRANGLRTGETRELERWRHIVGEVLDDVADAEGCFQALFAHFAAPRAWQCAEDVAAVLVALQHIGPDLSIASNYDRRLRSVVAGLPELSPIDHLVISSELGWRKPAPEFFAVLCDAHRVPPGQILYVGDDPVNDYDAAEAAGMRAVLCSASATGGRREISRLSQLVPDVDV